MVNHRDDNDRTHTHVALTKGTMVSHYRIVEKIGAGGMGEVYLAEDTKLNRQIALKFLPSHLCQDNDCRARFTREAQAVAKLNHPNIIHVYEVSEYQGRPFFAMELAEGQSLRDLAKGKDLSVDRIIELAIQICDGLGAAHDKKVVHRDIKPSNIVIDSYGRPKILDFGLAAVQGGENLTKTGSTLGTVRYMSPEQVQGQKVDHRSDLFSLGVVLYELISRRTPFEKENEAATLKAITQDSPEPLVRYKSNIPDELQRTVAKLLEKDPSLRYQTAGDVLSDLKRMITPTQSSVTPIRAKMKSWQLAVGGLMVTAVLLATVIKFWPGGKAEPPEAPMNERIMLAVLPFENLGSREDEYFADGITDEITSRVAVLDRVGVIARTSILQYKGTTKRISEIGRELGVDYILEGTIRWDKSGGIDKVRITPQLIQVSDETHLWADNIQRDLSQIFEVQEEIAKHIAEKLGVTLLSGHREILDYRPTQILDAYDYFLRAKSTWKQNHLLEAIELLKRAIELDSTFALAFALKSQIHSQFAFEEELGASEHTRPARFAYQRAFELQPDLAEAHLARGTYLNLIERDYSGALKEFEIARQGNVDKAQILYAISVVKLRQGKWNEAIALDQEIIQLDPLSYRTWDIMLQALWFVHNYEQALVELERLISLNPERGEYYAFKAQIQICMGEDVQQIQEPLIEWIHRFTGIEYIWEIEGVTFLQLLYSWKKQIDIEEKLSAIRKELPRNPNPTLYYNAGLLYRVIGERESSYAYMDSAISMVKNRIVEIHGDTTGRYEIYDLSLDVYDFLAMASSHANRHEQAIEYAQLAIESMPVEECHW